MRATLGLAVGLWCTRPARSARALIPTPTSVIPGGEDPRVLDVFRALGEEVGCSVQSFSQVLNKRAIEEEANAEAGVKPVEGANAGICWGLSALWLAERAKGIKNHDYLAAVGNWKENPTYNKAQLLWKNQRVHGGHGFLPRLLGMHAALDTEGRPKRKTAIFNNRLSRVSLQHNSDSVGFDQTDPRGLVNWWKKKKNRYFMISVERARHAVAAAYDKQGLSFFDPNGGIITCAKAESMTKFLLWYFANPKINSAYAAARNFPGQTGLIATKYKKGEAMAKPEVPPPSYPNFGEPLVDESLSSYHHNIANTASHIKMEPNPIAGGGDTGGGSALRGNE